jgi:HK97 family phage major capsid protein
MTTPEPQVAGPGAKSTSFGGVPFPRDVQAAIINLLIENAPFSASLTRAPTNRSSISWPTASPTGWAWLDELAAFPVIALGDAAYNVTVCKIGGIVDISNEAVSDNAINLTAGLATVLRDSLSRDLDLGIIQGTGTPPQPQGVTGIAATAVGADLPAQVTVAKGAIGDAGGTPTHLAVSATALAAVDATKGTQGTLVYPDGFAAAVGLIPVVVPALATPLVYDQSRCFLAVRNDATVEGSRDFHFNLDATSIRVKARVVGAVPAPAKSIRKCAVSLAAAEEATAHRSGKK